MTCLFAVDLHEPLALLRQVEAFVAQLGAELHVLHVEESLNVSTPAPFDALGSLGAMPTYTLYDAALVQALEEADWQAFKTFLERFERPVHVSFRHGNPVQAILEDADAIDADFILLGRHTHSALFRFFLGSTATDVVQEATRPLVLFPITEEEHPG